MMSLLDVEVFQEEGNLVITVYREYTFSTVCTHLDRFSPTIYNVGMIHLHL